MEPGVTPAAPSPDLWNEWAQAGKGERMADGHWPVVSQILSQMALKPGHQFLDVGCGNGYTVRWAASRVIPGGQALGVDFSPEMIARAESYGVIPGAAYAIAPAHQLPVPGNTIDWLLNVESLYYYPDIPAALVEFYRVLKPGGQLAIMVDYYQENPYATSWGTLLGVPMAYLSTADYTALLVQAGFQGVRPTRVMNPEPVDPETFRPAWGFETVVDVVDWRTRVGSLVVWAQKPQE